MPIRFRCAYCNQLLGIAHRKAGRVVRCPTCSGQVVVPNPDPVRDEADEKDIPPNNPNLFEGSLDDVLGMPQPAMASPGPVQPPAGAWGTHGEPAYAPSRPIAPPSAGAPPPPVSIPPAPLVLAPSQQPPGVFLSPTRATLLVVSGILGLAVAFGAGILVGKYLLVN